MDNLHRCDVILDGCYTRVMLYWMDVIPLPEIVDRADQLSDPVLTVGAGEAEDKVISSVQVYYSQLVIVSRHADACDLKK